MQKRLLTIVFTIALLVLFTSPAASQIRINEISHGEVDFMGSTNWVELYNAGTEEEDVSDLFLCDFPSYPRISSLTVLSGSMTIPAGGYLVVSWANVDDDAEIGLYTSDTNNFGEASFVIDYMQYGSAGHTREPAAVQAQVWTAGEFVALAPTGQSLQYFDNSMVGSGNWSSADATPGQANVIVNTSNEDITGVPDGFRLNGNYPNPFNPVTTISFELANTGNVTLSVFDVLGREINTLVSGEFAVGQYEVTWDGSDYEGNVVPSGTYLYRLSLEDGNSITRIMTLLK